MRRFRLPLLTTAFAMAFQLLMGGTARAHHPEIAAEAVCDAATGVAVINYTSTSWLLSLGGGGNPQINILVNSVLAGSGAYTVANGFSFSGSAPAPAGSGPGDTVSVTAVAVGTWDSGAAGGQSTSTTVTLPSQSCGAQAGLGRFTGGGHQIRVGAARVTRGLTIHCDLLLSNNLQVNWGGNQFHMTEHLTTVACTDDPLIVQAPPPAPLDTLVGVGTGRYNGVNGFTIQFTLVDAGEPGTSDRAALRIFQTSNPGNVVLNVPLQLITGGNLQAHYDQPHK